MSWWARIFHSKTTECSCHLPQKNLAQAAVGQPLQVKCLHGEEGACQRLREMGFCESSVVEKIADSGALICKVCDTKLVISKQLAEHIIVTNICQLKGHKSARDISNTVLLSKMSAGQKAIIDDFVVAGDDCERIEEMGLTPGEEIEVVRYAPLGDPIEIKVRGYSLSLRKQEADLIRVTLI